LPWQRYREIAAGAGLKSAGVLAKRAQNAWFWTTRALPGLLAKATQIEAATCALAADQP